jgi:hypothetical protein
VKRLGLDTDPDVSLNPMGGTGAARLAALESGLLDAVILDCPENRSSAALLTAPFERHALVIGDLG